MCARRGDCPELMVSNHDSLLSGVEAAGGLANQGGERKTVEDTPACRRLTAAIGAGDTIF